MRYPVYRKGPEPLPLMKPLQKDLEYLDLTQKRTDTMPAESRKDWLLTKMDTIYNLREEGYSYDDIARRYPMTANSIRRVFLSWLKETGKLDPRQL